jgi:hypothetical protein
VFSFACPSCQQTLKAPEEKRGAQTRCPYCKQTVVIPLADPVPAAAVAPAPVEEKAGLARSFGGDFIKDLGVTAAGAATSFVTVFLVWLIERGFNFSLYTLTYCCVFPAGAMLVGGLAASGYYFGAFYLGRRPSPWLLLNIVVISVLAFFEIHSLTYNSLKVNIGFFDYLAFVYQESEHQIRGSSIGKLGAWGYLEMLLQIGGFALGGIVVWALLSAQPYCEKCQRYLSAKGKQQRYSPDPVGFWATAKQMAELVAAGRVQEAIDLHAASGPASASKDAVIQSSVQVKRCTACNVHWIGFTVQKKSGNEWQEDETLKFASFHQAEFAVRS